MFPAERRQMVVDIVTRQGAQSVAELAAATGASAVTVRRDLADLQTRGLLLRRHGGAVAPGFETHEPSYAEKTGVAAEAKAAIGVVAATLVRPGDSVILGAGTSTQALARALHNASDLVVVTNSVLVAQELANAPGVEVVMTGGNLRGSTFSLIGAAAERSLAAISASRTFLSGNGMTAERGLSTPHAGVASMDRALAAAAREVVVLADHTKIGVDALVQTVPPEGIATVVTDGGTDRRSVASLRRAGITVLVG